MDDANLLLSKHATALDTAMEADDQEIASLKQTLQQTQMRRSLRYKMRKDITNVQTFFEPFGLWRPEPGIWTFVRAYETRDGILTDVTPLVIPDIVIERTWHRPTPETRGKSERRMTSTPIAPEEVITEATSRYPDAKFVRGTFADALWQPCPSCVQPAFLTFTYLPPLPDDDQHSFRYESFEVNRICFDCERIDDIAMYTHERDYPRSHGRVTAEERARHLAEREAVPLLKAFTYVPSKD